MNEEYLKEKQAEWEFYRTLVRWGAGIVLALIGTVAAYNIADRMGPVKPNVHLEYSWPSGMPSK